MGRCRPDPAPPSPSEEVLVGTRRPWEGQPPALQGFPREPRTGCRAPGPRGHGEPTGRGARRWCWSGNSGTSARAFCRVGCLHRGLLGRHKSHVAWTWGSCP